MIYIAGVMTVFVACIALQIVQDEMMLTHFTV